MSQSNDLYVLKLERGYKSINKSFHKKYSVANFKLIFCFKRNFALKKTKLVICLVLYTNNCKYNIVFYLIPA